MQAIKKIGLIPRMILGILVGILVGLYLPDWFVRITITFSSIFGAFLNFIIPLMILAFVTKGIAEDKITKILVLSHKETPSLGEVFFWSFAFKSWS